MTSHARLGKEHGEPVNKPLQQLPGDELGFYGLVISAMAEGVVLQDANGILRASNPSAERILGLTKEQLSGLTSMDPRWRAIHEDGSPYPGETHPAMLCLRTGTPCSGVMGIHQPNGELKWISINSQPLLEGAEPKPYAVVSTFVDITERLRSEKALKEAKELFSKAFLASPEGIAISDLATGRYIEVNDAFVRLIGFERSELVGKSSLELHIWQHSERSVLVESLNERRMIRGQEMKFRTKSGRMVEVEVSAEVVRLGNQACLLGIVRDITDRKQLEEQLRQAQKMEAIGRLAGGVAHDFNNLLGVILGYAEMVLEKMPPFDPLRKSIEEINKASSHAAALTSQLLAFSRKQIVQARPIDLNAIVEKVRDLLQRVIGEHIELVTTFEIGLAKVLADPHQIEQVLLNLCVNARDAMPGGGTLSIETMKAKLDESFSEKYPELRPGTYVRISVKDTGQGVAKDILPYIFEPFFTTKESGKGTGLGLAMVYGIVKQAGGGILVRSDPGEGTCFDIYLPEATAFVMKDDVKPESNDKLTGSETLLLVEDASAMREVCCRLLQDAGYKVLDCANATEASAKAREHQGEIHLLLINVFLRGMTGKALAEKLIEIRPRARILYTCDYANEALLPSEGAGQRFDILAKPYTRKLLLEKVREVLDRLED